MSDSPKRIRVADNIVANEADAKEQVNQLMHAICIIHGDNHDQQMQVLTQFPLLSQECKVVCQELLDNGLWQLAEYMLTTFVDTRSLDNFNQIEDWIGSCACSYDWQMLCLLNKYRTRTFSSKHIKSMLIACIDCDNRKGYSLNVSCFHYIITTFSDIVPQIDHSCLFEYLFHYKMQLSQEVMNVIKLYIDIAGTAPAAKINFRRIYNTTEFYCIVQNFNTAFRTRLYSTPALIDLLVSDAFLRLFEYTIDSEDFKQFISIMFLAARGNVVAMKSWIAFVQRVTVDNVHLQKKYLVANTHRLGVQILNRKFEYNSLQELAQQLEYALPILHIKKNIDNWKVIKQTLLDTFEVHTIEQIDGLTTLELENYQYTMDWCEAGLMVIKDVSEKISYPTGLSLDVISNVVLCY